MRKREFLYIKESRREKIQFAEMESKLLNIRL